MNNTIYKYYSTERPIDIGTYPSENNIEFLNYDKKQYVDEIKKDAWGELLYNKPLTVEKQKEFELVESPLNENIVRNDNVVQEKAEGVSTHGEKNETGETEKMAAKINGDEPTTIKDEVLQRLKDGIKDTLDSEHFANWCKKQGKLYYNGYSFNNALLTYIQKPDASYVCGYEAWKGFGRQVKQGSKGIKILAPVFAKEYGGKGSLFASILKNCASQFKKNPALEYATYHLGQSYLSFNMYKNNLFDVKVYDEVRRAHITPDDLKKLLDREVVGKVPVYYNAVTVFDVSDTTNDVPYLWVNKEACKRSEIVLDDNGNPIKNKRGQVKIVNSEERKATFDVDIILNIEPQDTKKMQLLYNTLKNVSGMKKIPVSEIEPKLDEALSEGALGYYRHPTEEFPNGNIVISSELSITDKVAVAFHEIAHSDMHRDIEKLKKEMGGNVDTITTQIKEIQAEAVAYMAASTFGIETDHKSFNYIAHWSDGRELQSLEASLSVIYNESKKLLDDIKKDLDRNGLTMNLQEKKKQEISKAEKESVMSEFKEFFLYNLKENELIAKAALSDLQLADNKEEKKIIKDQILLTQTIDKKLSEFNSRSDEFEQTQEEDKKRELTLQIKALRSQIRTLQNDINELSLERIAVIRKLVEKDKEDMKHMYAHNPMNAMKKLKEDFSEMKDTSEADLKYLATSSYISRNYSKFLGSNNKKFVELAMNQLKNFKSVLSKNKTAVEVSFCEQWGDKPIFVAGTVSHPKLANEIFASAEKQIRDIKKSTFYPYTSCNIQLYSYTSKNELLALETRIDIGDGYQDDLTDHLEKLSGTDSIKEKIVDNYNKSLRERTNIQLLMPANSLDKSNGKETGNVKANHVLSMSDWKNNMKEQGLGRNSENKESITNTINNSTYLKE